MHQAHSGFAAFRWLSLSTALLLMACGGASDSDDKPYRIGGMVSGLHEGKSFTLTLDDAQGLPVSANGSFVFPRKKADGDSYLVTVTAQPQDQICGVTNNSGTVAGASIDDIAVTCAGYSTPLLIGGSTFGLGEGKTLTLTMSYGAGGRATLVITDDSGFSFGISQRIESGSSYDVTVKVQPPGQICNVTNGSGTATAPVTNILVTCYNLGA